jgi:hypothetical protein
MAMTSTAMTSDPDRVRRPSGVARARHRRRLASDFADLAAPLARWAVYVWAMLGVLHVLGLANLAHDAR